MKKIKATLEMLEDLFLMGDREYCKKWKVSRRIPIQFRKEFKIKSFINQHATKDHKFENGIEYKWCQKEHWEVLSEFYKDSNRYDGLRCYCKFHGREESKKHYHEGNYNEQKKEWKKTERGRISQRGTWRRQSAKKNGAYVSWTIEDEERALIVFESRCAYCSKEISLLKMEFDHFIPITNGGKTEPSNMIPCCKSCNHGTDGKFNMDALEWLLKKFGASRGTLIYSDVLDKINKIKRMNEQHNML